MFDIGFWELTLIGIIALLVIGPERLPRVARTAGLWFGKARYFISNVKADIDKELKADELKRIMAEQSKSSGMHEFLDETRSALDEVNTSMEGVDTSEFLVKADDAREAFKAEMRGEDSLEKAKEETKAAADPAELPPTSEADKP